MKTRTTVFAFAACAAAVSAAGSLSDRWIYVTDPLVDKDCAEKISNIVCRAKSCGMNGMMLDCGLDYCRYWPKERHDRIGVIRKVCRDEGVEIIPSIWGLGYGAMQNYGIDCLEGVPVEGVPFVARGTNAVYDAASAESVSVSPSSGFQRSDGYCRLIKKVGVKPHRRYRYSFEYRTENLSGKLPFRVIAVDAHSRAWHEKEAIKLDYKPTQDWTPCELSFNTSESDSYYLYIGFMGGWEAGDIKVRGTKLVEVAPSCVVQRPGAPFALRNAATGEKYEPGRDYVVPKMRYPVWRQDRPPVTLSLPPGSRVKDGDRLVFDCYAPSVVNGRQSSTCLSEPRLYKSMEDSAARLEAMMHPKRWMLSMDEFRNGGTCAACRARGMTMGQMYADAVTKMFNIIQKVHPGAEVYIWSDMLDPNHNAIKEYYSCIGSFEDAWKWIPKDIVVCCWYNRKSDISMPFFASHGFRTFAAAYYDEKPPFKYSRKWCDVVLRTEGAVGIMYTTWRHNYENMPAFGEMIREKLGE